jgi:hypothetical protein
MCKVPHDSYVGTRSSELRGEGGAEVSLLSNVTVLFLLLLGYPGMRHRLLGSGLGLTPWSMVQNPTDNTSFTRDLRSFWRYFEPDASSK